MLYFVVEKSRRSKERAAGIGGAVLAAPWVFQGVLRIIDWISRGQTAMTIAPYLGVLTHPVAFVLEFLGAVGLLFYATRLEHYREAQETPLIIRPWSEPEQPQRHWFSLKIGLATGFLSVLGAVAVFVVHSKERSNSVSVLEQSPVSAKATVAGSAARTRQKITSKSPERINKGSIESPPAPPVTSSNPGGPLERGGTSDFATVVVTHSAEVGTTPVVLLPENPKRRSFTIQNSGTTVIYIVLGTENPGPDHFTVSLAAGGTKGDGSSTPYTNREWRGEVRAISKDAGGSVSTAEFK